MNDIFMLSDAAISVIIGNRLKQTRLRQNITQQDLAEDAGVSLSSIKKKEKGEIGSFDILLRMLRTTGLLELLQPLVDEQQPSPSEYYQNWFKTLLPVSFQFRHVRMDGGDTASFWGRLQQTINKI